MTKATSQRYRPPLWPTVAFVVACSICISAGFWQLGRAEQKRALFADFDRTDDAVLTRIIDAADIDAVLFRRIQLTGRYLDDRQILLDNMTAQGRPGYQVLTPFLTNGSVVLINRGWVAAGNDRLTLPDVSVQDKIRTVTGRYYWLPRAGYELDAPPAEADTAWPRRLSFPTVEVLSDQLERPVPNFQILLEPAEQDGYLREWRPALMLPEKHLAYAIQWFLMALTIFIIYAALTTKAARRAKQNGKPE